MGQRPNHNRIIESWADSNQYSRFVLVVSRFESKFWKAFRFVSWFESKPWKGFWVVSRLESKFWKTIWVMSHLNWLPENHFESWVNLNQFLKAIVSHELSRNQNFLRLSWIKSKKWVVPMSALRRHESLFHLQAWEHPLYVRVISADRRWPLQGQGCSRAFCRVQRKRLSDWNGSVLD